MSFLDRERIEDYSLGLYALCQAHGRDINDVMLGAILGSIIRASISEVDEVQCSSIAGPGVVDIVKHLAFAVNYDVAVEEAEDDTGPFLRFILTRQTDKDSDQ